MDFKKLLLSIVASTFITIAGLISVGILDTRKQFVSTYDKGLQSNISFKSVDFSTGKPQTVHTRSHSISDKSLKHSNLNRKQNEIFHIGCNKIFSNPRFSQLQEYWQSVEETSLKSHHVFSAYHDNDGTPPGIKIIGNVNNQLKCSLFCQLWYHNGSDSNSMTISNAIAEPLAEGHGLRHRVSFFRCHLPNSMVPVAVSLTSKKCMTPNNLLPVRSHVVNDKDKKRFTVCIAPLFGRYNRTSELIQWIELNRIIGADYFVFYNYSTSIYVDRVLNFYVRKGLVEVVHWNVSNFSIEYQMHYFGQHAAMNDCLMRMKNISEFVVNSDLDEVLVPHSKYSTWNDIVKHKPNYGGYLFRHSFFRLNWNNTEKEFPKKDSAVKYNLFTVLKSRRESTIDPPKNRSKYFCRSNVTESMGTHEIFKLKASWHSYTLAPETGLVQHYRIIYIDANGTIIPDPYNQVKNLIDDTIYSKYKDTLIENIIRTYTEIKQEAIEI